MKTTILDTCPRISIYQLIRLGAFKKNSTFHFQDSINALSYTITTDVSGSSPVINIDLKSSAGVVHQSVRVHVAPSHLGNHQVLRLICPFTGTRCCILHLYKYYFMHRSAFKSTYASRTICPSRRHIAHTIRAIYTGQKYLWLATRPYLRISYRGQPTRTFLRLQRFALRHANRLFTFPTPKTFSTISTVLNPTDYSTKPPFQVPKLLRRYPSFGEGRACLPVGRVRSLSFPTFSTNLNPTDYSTKPPFPSERGGVRSLSFPTFSTVLNPTDYSTQPPFPSERAGVRLLFPTFSTVLNPMSYSTKSPFPSERAGVRSPPRCVPISSSYTSHSISGYSPVAYCCLPVATAVSAYS